MNGAGAVVLRWGRGWGGALAVAMLALGCSEEEPLQVQVARQFVQAVQSGEIEDVLALLDAPAADHVKLAAAGASDQVGGRRSIEPQEMLQVVDVDPHFQIDEAELGESNEQWAVVRLQGADGSSRSLELVNENGSWKVHLPLPRAPMVEP